MHIGNTDEIGEDQGNLSVTTETFTAIGLHDTDQSKTEGQGINIQAMAIT